MNFRTLTAAILALAPALAGCGTTITKTSTTVQVDKGGQTDVKSTPKDVKNVQDMGLDIAVPFVGCTAKSDKTFLELTTIPVLAAELKDDLRTCTLMKGCGAKIDFAAKIQCISDCMLLKYDGEGLTDSCGLCFGFYGQCGVEKCIAKCAVDTGECDPCMAVFCDGGRDKCRAGVCDPKSGGCNN